MGAAESVLMANRGASQFPHLFAPVEIGPVTVPNRIVSTGHHTYLTDRAPNRELIAYHEARAKGGAGLIVTEIIAVHETAMFSGRLLSALDESCIPPYRALADRLHAHGTKVFAQLFHQGREILSSTTGMIPATYAPSAVPNERFHMMPRPMPVSLIHDIVEGFGRAAGYLAAAGYDGVEIVGNQGYLPAQFLCAATNRREDAYGGDFQRRLRFVREVIATARSAAPDLALGLRISGDELDDCGLNAEDVVEICAALSDELDYFSVVAGTSASLGASVHIVPPMGIESGYTAPYGAAIRQRTGKPVIVTGRINQPQVAESLLAGGQADLCGMTRALVADPDMPDKTARGALDEIRACIGCNQSCIGRAHKGLPISCIQNPTSGRETTLPPLARAERAKRVMVIGGGPAGMQAAIAAAQRSHDVTLYEASPHLGGQALLAQKLPGREEFGGIVTNFASELRRAGGRVETGVAMTAETIRSGAPDTVILATGARPYMPEFEGCEEAHVVNAWDVVSGRTHVGSTVVVADWRADWIGLGLAEDLSRKGSAVTLCSNAVMAGESLQVYTRNHYVGRLFRLGVAMVTHARLFGVAGGTVYFQNTLSLEPIVLEGVDTVVLSLGHTAVDSLVHALSDEVFEVLAIGDCLSPRTAEEAVYEGLLAGRGI